MQPEPAVREALPSVAGDTPGRPAGTPADTDPYAVYLASLAPQARRAMAGCLDRLARLAADTALDDPAVTGRGQPWHELRYPHTTALRTALLAQGWSPAHANKHLVALRRVLREAWRLGLITAEDYHRAADLPAVPGSRLPAGRAVADRELAAILAACDTDPSPAGVRDAAVLAVLYSAGLRRGEAAGLDLTDWDPLERSLRVLGKGDRQRLVYLTPDAVPRLDAWLHRRGRQRGPLFCPVLKNGRIVIRRLSGQALANLLDKRGRAAGVAPASPHDLRRTFVGDLLDAGADLATVQALAGHASPTTTTRYDRRPQRTRRNAADLLRLPAATSAEPSRPS